MPAELSLAFWNVQDLFEPGTVDRGPADRSETDAKLDRLAALLLQAGGGNSPHVVGLAEIHTEALLTALADRLPGDWHRFWSAARPADRTGLGLLLRRDVVATAARIGLERGLRPHNLLVRGDDAFVVGVAHWKSRWPTAPVRGDRQRLLSARWLGDALAAADLPAVVVGDFNCQPDEPPFGPAGLPCVRRFADLRPGGVWNAAWGFLPGADRDPRAVWPSLIFDQLLVRAPSRPGGLAFAPKHVSFWTTDQPTGTAGMPQRWQWRHGRAGGGVSDHFPLVARMTMTANDNTPPSAAATTPAAPLNCLRAALGDLGAALRVEPGYLAEPGLLHDVVLTSPDGLVRDLLCRLWIPEDGFPVTCDWLDGEPVVAADAAALTAALTAFLATPEARARLATTKVLQFPA